MSETNKTYETTLKEAAEFLAVSERTVKRYRERGKLSVDYKRPQPGEPETAYYSMSELEELKAELAGEKIQPRVMPMPTNDTDLQTLTPLVNETSLELLDKILTPFSEALNNFADSQKRLNPAPDAPEEKPQFLTLEQTLEEFPLSKGNIRRMMKDGRLNKFTGKHGETLLSRKELENL